MSFLLAVLLHQGGWDEVLMVAVGLGLAYLIIVWSGQRKTDGDENENEDEDDAEGGEGHDGVGVRRDEGPRAADGPRDQPTAPTSSS